MDANACQQAAANMRGMCVTNPDEQRAPSGGAPFCVYASWGTQCIYYDADACRQAASSQRAACIPNPNR
jgi:hypothetical protein